MLSVTILQFNSAILHFDGLPDGKDVGVPRLQLGMRIHAMLPVCRGTPQRDLRGERGREGSASFYCWGGRRKMEEIFVRKKTDSGVVQRGRP